MENAVDTGKMWHRKKIAKMGHRKYVLSAGREMSKLFGHPLNLSVCIFIVVFYIVVMVSHLFEIEIFTKIINLYCHF